jgi:hypothetical protein
VHPGPELPIRSKHDDSTAQNRAFPQIASLQFVLSPVFNEVRFFLEIADESLRFDAGVTSLRLKTGLHATSIALAP